MGIFLVAHSASHSIECPLGTDTYVGETSRLLGTRFKKRSRLKPPLLQLVNIAKTTTTTSNRWCASCSQGGTFLEKENTRSHRDRHPTAITQQGRRLRPPVIYDDLLSHDTTLNEEVDMTLQATSLLQSRLWKSIYYLLYFPKGIFQWNLAQIRRSLLH